MKGDYETGIKIYSKEIEFNKSSPSGYNKRGFCYAKINLYAEAIQDYSSSIKMDDVNTHAYHNRGICYQKLSKFELVSTPHSQN